MQGTINVCMDSKETGLETSFKDYLDYHDYDYFMILTQRGKEQAT